MERMRKVANGVIEAPSRTRQDAAAALAICSRITQAPHLWDGTLKDLAGYLRMMGAIIKGTLQIKEVLPPINNYPAPPVFDFIVAITLNEADEEKPTKPIIDVFIKGAPHNTEESGIHFPEELIPRGARQKFESTDPEIRAVVGACAAVHHTILLDGAKSNTKLADRLFRLAMIKLLDPQMLRSMRQSGDRLTAVQEGDATLASLQKAINDKLGVTPEELSLEDVMFYCHWRIGAASLGLDNYFVQGELPLVEEERGTAGLESTTRMRPGYLPPHCDLALHLGSKPNLYPPKKVLEAAYRGLVNFAHWNGGEGQAWAQLRLQWSAAKAVMAGASLLPKEEDNQPAVLTNQLDCFTAAQLRPHVDAADKLLERMRPWLGGVAAFEKIEKDFEGWRKKYITGKDEKLSLPAVPMNFVRNQFTARDGDGDKKLRTCASCENFSEKLKVCSACKQVWYCNSICQKAGWKAHKKACITSRKNA